MPPSSSLTQGEQYFEQACAATGIRARRFPVARMAGFRHPDYKLSLPKCGALAEVKQLDPSDEDRRVVRDIQTRFMEIPTIKMSKTLKACRSF